ncbi:hypothetical protein QWJ34_03550 [Saccharibacillus sp. CPCC 101409]|uniref:hypothetical protein n=1 Tax=Saccharibacillus sp. CPCC 101409 TaxID=3058041 RepID=UPI002671FE8D|nr:hypothetical protein [Saccharibacillus sp. CPCC 101409]MDO3408833.1 hypothetical protein [Saccharibacillus sp. CPCC 101409]
MAFSLNRLPVWNYKFELLISAIFAAGVSFILRMMLQAAWVDLLIQPVLLFILMRGVLKIKSFYSAVAVVSGYAAYFLIQIAVLQTLIVFGRGGEIIVNTADASDVQTIQLVSIASAYFLSALFKIFNLGFSYITRPPHDFAFREDYRSNGNRGLLLSVLVAGVTLAVAVVLLFHLQTIFLLPVAVAAAGLLYFFSSRRDQRDY